MRKFNYSYILKYKQVNSFNFDKINDLVSYSIGYDRLYLNIIDAAYLLKDNIKSRQAICVLNTSTLNSCLISIQFLFDDLNKFNLHVIANFRSQHATLGRPTDEKLINYYITIFLNTIEKYNIIPNCVNIDINVGDYHD